MHGIEALARRERLGLDRAGFATVLGLGCDEASVAAFEAGHQPVPDHVEARLTALEFAQAQISGVLQDRFTDPILTTYTSNQDFWRDWPGMEGVPVGVHHTAAADALTSLRWAGVPAHIETAPAQS